MVWQTRLFQTIIALMVAVLLGATSVRADLTPPQNGAFSQPDGAHWTQLLDGSPVDFTLVPGAAFLREKSNEDYDYDRNGTPLTGGGFNLTGIKQEFTLTQAATVAVGFTFELTVTAPTETDYFDVLFDNDIVFSQSTSGLVPTPGPGGITFTASPQESRFLEAGSHWLTLRLVGEDDWIMDGTTKLYPLLTTVTVDDVTCSVVPLPGAALLGTLGLSYSAWRLQRRRIP